MMTDKSRLEKALYGCLLGGAVGDAYGLTYEGIAPTRLAKILLKFGFILSRCYAICCFW